MLFGYATAPYRGRAKNTRRPALLLGLGNLLTAQRRLPGGVDEVGVRSNPPWTGSGGGPEPQRPQWEPSQRTRGPSERPED